MQDKLISVTPIIKRASSKKCDDCEAALWEPNDDGVMLVPENMNK